MQITAGTVDTLPTQLPAHLADGSVLTRSMGVAVVAIFPALVWTLFFSFAAEQAGFTLGVPALGVFALAVATFLTAVCAPLMLRD